MNDEEDYKYDEAEFGSDDDYFNEEAQVQSDIEPDRTAEDDTPVYSDHSSNNNRGFGYFFAMALVILVLIGGSLFGYKAFRDRHSGTSEEKLIENQEMLEVDFKAIKEEEPPKEEQKEPEEEKPAEEKTEEKKDTKKKNTKKTSKSSSNSGTTNSPTTEPTTPTEDKPTYKRQVVHSSYIPIAGFKADDSISRTDFVKWILMANRVDISSVVYKNIFVDVDESTKDWKYIHKAYELGLISGKPNNEFSPNEPIKRIEAAIVTLNFIDYFKLPSPKEECKAVYQEPISPDQWVYQPLQRAMKICILSTIPGSYGRVRAEYPINKGDAAYMIYRALSRDVQHATMTCDEYYSVPHIDGLKVEEKIEDAILDGAQNHVCYEY